MFSHVVLAQLSDEQSLYLVAHLKKTYKVKVMYVYALVFAHFSKDQKWQ